MDLRCQYASTHCPNMRSLKISGEPHRFCLFHRRSANAAQRRWKQKKQAAEETAASSSDEKPAPKAPAKRRAQSDSAPSKRPRQSRQSQEIAAPRAWDSFPLAPVMPACTSTLEQEAPFPTDTIAPLFSHDDMTLLNKLILDVEDAPEPILNYPVTQSDCWWTDAGVIV